MTNTIISTLANNGILSTQEAEDLRASDLEVEVDIESIEVDVTWTEGTDRGRAHKARKGANGKVELWIGWDGGTSDWHPLASLADAKAVEAV